MLPLAIVIAFALRLTPTTRIYAARIEKVIFLAGTNVVNLHIGRCRGRTLMMSTRNYYAGTRSLKVRRRLKSVIQCLVQTQSNRF